MLQDLMALAYTKLKSKIINLFNENARGRDIPSNFQFEASKNLSFIQGFYIL